MADHRAAMRNAGRTATVTVTAPQIGPGFRVADVWGPGTPIQEAGTYGFTASVRAGGLPQNLRTRWRMVRSFSPNDTTDVEVPGATANLLVPSGSYTLRLIVSPVDVAQETTGLHYIEDFTVCTEGAEAPGSGAGTNAVEGCGGPPPLY